MMDAAEMKILKRIRDRQELPNGPTTKAIVRRLIDRGVLINTPGTTPSLRLSEAGSGLIPASGGMSGS